jgi:hypothetical protein
MAAPNPKMLSEIATKMGLNAIDAGTFIGRVTVNPQVASVIAGAAGGGSGTSIDPKYNSFLKTMGDKYKQDPSFVSKLNDDLKANPALKDKLTTAVKNHPDLAAKEVASYQSGQLGQSVSRLEQAISQRAAPQSAPSAAPSAAPSTATADAAAAETARLAARAQSARPSPAATAAASAAPARAQAAPPPTTAAPSTTAPATPPQAAAPDAAAIQAAAATEVMKTLATASDDKIREVMTPDMVQQLATGVAAYSDKHYPEMATDAKGFVAKVGEEGLSKRIAENLQRNPQLIRDLAKTMNEEPDPNDPLAKMKKDGVRDTLKQIYAEPEKLADENFTEKLGRKFQMAEGGIGGMLKGFLGNDMGGLGGIMNKLGGVFQGIMNWFGNAMSAFSSGNFALMGNMDPKSSMWERFSYGVRQAELTKGLENYAQVIPRTGAQGPMNGNGKVVDAQGKPVMEEVKDETGKVVGQRQKMDDSFDHRVEYGGKKFYLTNGLQPSAIIRDGQPIGQNRWYVATSVDADGRPRKIDNIVLSDADSQKLMDRLEREAKAAGTELKLNTPVKQLEPSNTTVIDAKNGRPVDQKTAPDPSTEPDPQQKLAQNTPGSAPRFDVGVAVP